MADQTTSYVIQVSDGVDPQIQRKLGSIATTADTAGKSCAALQQQINSINSSGLSTVNNSVSQASAAQRSLSTTTSGYARSAGSATTATNKLSSSMATFQAQVIAVDAALTALVSTSVGYAAVASSISSATSQMASSQNGAAQATSNLVGGTRNMTAALGVARGNITSANRLAASFLSTLVGSGPIMQAAFSALGALALVAVLGEIVHAVYDVVTAYHSLSDAAREADVAQASMAADGLETVKAKVTLTEGLSRALKLFSTVTDTPNEIATVTGQTQQIQTTSGLQKQIALQNEYLTSVNGVNEAGLKSAALARQRQTDMQAEIALRATQIEQAQTLRAAATNVVSNKESTDNQVKVATQQITSSTELISTLITQMSVLQNNKIAEGKISAVDAVKDEAKAASEEMRNLEAAYKNYVASLSTKITPTQQLAFWQSAEAGLKHYDTNIDKVNAKEAEPQQRISSRNDSLGRTNEGLDDQIKSIGAYSDVLKISNDLDKQKLEYQKTGIPLTAQETSILLAKYTLIQTNAQYQQELNTQYQAANGALRTYNATQQALNKLLDDGAITVGEFNGQMALATRQFEESQSPVVALNRQIDQTRATFGLYGTQLEVTKQVQDAVNASMNTTHPISMTQAADLQRNLTLLQQQQALQNDVNALFEQNAGAMQKLVAEQLALNDAQAKGIITATQYQNLTIQNKVQQSTLQNSTGNTSVNSVTMQALGGTLKGYQGIAEGATKAWADFFDTLNKGFADSVSHALVFGGSVSKALGTAAKQAVQSLTSALIKLATQWAITSALGMIPGVSKGSSFSSLLSGTGGAGGSSTGAGAGALGGLAAAAGLGTMLTAKPGQSASGGGLQQLLGTGKQGTSIAGQLMQLFHAGGGAASSPISAFTSADTITSASSVAAEAGDVGSAAASGAGVLSDWWTALGGLGFLAGGGEVTGKGTSTSDSNHYMLSNGEYVVNASAYAAHKDAVEAINSGARNVYSVGATGSGSYSNASGSTGQMSVEVHNYNGSHVQAQQMDDNSVRLIVRDEVPGLIAQHAPGVIANDVANPNGKTAKALKQNVTASRIR